MFRVAAESGVHYKGKIMFVSRMYDPRGFMRIAPSVGFMAPPLSQAGYEVVVSNARVVPLEKFAGINPETRQNFQKELRRSVKNDIDRERPDFVGFPVYDANVLSVVDTVRQLAREYPKLGLAFGGPWVSLNHAIAVEQLGSLPNVIIVNGEAELVLPPAMDAYLSRTPIDRPGVFVNHDRKFLGGDFAVRVFLTPEEHEALDFIFDVQLEQLKFMMDEKNKMGGAGVDLFGSRACFRGCSYCAASNALRSRFVTWSTGKRLRFIEEALAWSRRHGNTGVLRVGFQEDNWGYIPAKVIEFLEKYKQSSLKNETQLHVQMGPADFFTSGGEFRFDLLEAMVDGDKPMVQLINLGGDFWDQAGRARNRGKGEGRLTNEQVRFAVAEFAKRKIAVKLYSLLGDELTTLPEFVEAMLFLQELQIDFAPYVDFTFPEPIVPYSGTPIRPRLEGTEQGRKMLVKEGALGQPGSPNYHPVYGRMRIPVKIIEEAYQEGIVLRGKLGSESTCDLLLAWFYTLFRNWQMEHDANAQKMNTALEIIDGGGKRADALAALEGVTTSFKYICPRIYTLDELLDLALAARKIPDYYLSGKTLREEAARRNPHLEEVYEQAAMSMRIDAQIRAVLPAGSLNIRKPDASPVIADRKALRRAAKRQAELASILTAQPVVRDASKVGRNDPCPCGSGKKYKKCCLTE